VLLGGRDLLVRSRASYVRATAQAGWEAHIIPRAGHVLAEEVPQAVLEGLIPHLGRAG
jgi:pimeloyl-ACP methyl ester carboxylesterase